MAEATTLIGEMSTYQEQYTALLKRLTAFSKYQHEEMQKRKFGTVYTLSDYIFVLEIMKDVPDLNTELIKLLNDY